MANSNTNIGPSFPARLNPSSTRFSAVSDKLGFMLRSAMPGIIQSFNATAQTVTVLPVIRDEPSVAGYPTVVSVPLLTDIPICIPRAGIFSLTMPVQAGDECLLVFCDRCIDTWFQSGGVQNELETRRHELSDATAILAPWSQPRVLADYSQDSAQLRSEDGTVIVDVAGSQITLSAPTISLTGQNINISASSQVTITSGANDTAIDNKTFLTHAHTGVEAGGAVSGPVE